MAKSKRYFPTNTDNLRMIFAQGLISSPSGFGKKYYADALEIQNGYIPLYKKDKIPEECFELATSESEDMVACIIEIEQHDIVESNDVEIFIPAPLPLSCISKIIFSNDTHKKDFKGNEGLYSNLVLGPVKLSSTKSEQKLFPEKDSRKKKHEQGALEMPSFSANKLEESDYEKIYAYGGVLFNLFYYAKNGKLSNDVFNKFCNFELGSSEGGCKELAKIDFIYKYFENSSQCSNTESREYKVLISIIEILIENKNVKENIGDFLTSEDCSMEEGKRRLEIFEQLKKSEEATEIVSDLLKDSKSITESLLLMLFVNANSEELFNFKTFNFCETDHLLFSLAFGIRDKFIKTPKNLREFTNLQLFVSTKMAEYANRIANNKESGIRALNTPPTLWKMLESKNIILKKKLIKELEMENCVQTIMPAKNFTHKANANIYKGFIAPDYKVIEEDYFKEISQKQIGPELYNAFVKAQK